MQQAKIKLDFVEACPSCADNIQKALEIMPGVQHAEIEFEQQQAVVDYDETQTNPEKMVDMISRAGYHTQHV